MKNIQFEYKALNLMDEVCTVEVTLDYKHKSFHIFDIDGAVYPSLCYAKSQYLPSDEFLKMRESLKGKYLTRDFFASLKGTEFWVLYSPNNKIFGLKIINEEYEIQELDISDKVFLLAYKERL